ncbi:MAG: class I SAM-dependent methyltransferase, partial [Ardenticatenia bacterium]|nr:class I SAM-dependent methyltransferase [Ardenticatenia bacterium]
MKEPSLRHSSYDPTYHELLSKVETRHFWFRARNQVVAGVVRRLAADMPTGYRVLEIGCGTGNVLRVLQDVCANGTVVGADLFLEGLRHARQRTSAMLVQTDMHALPFGVPFHLIGLFDVLEHLPDDRQALRDLHGLLDDDGRLVLTVPAHPSLWSYFDEASYHCRRYDRLGLQRKLHDAGYRVEQLTYFMASILPLVWLGRGLRARLSRGPNRDTVRMVNSA